jgi:hypothetical protein
MNQIYRKMKEILPNLRHGSLCKAIPDFDRNTDIPSSIFCSLEKSPKSLATPEALKLAIDSVCNMDPSRNDIKVRRRKSEFKVLVGNVKTAERIADSFKPSDDSVAVKIKAKQFMGILKQIPFEFHDGLLAFILNCTKTECCGLLLAFKLSFVSQNNLENFLKYPLNMVTRISMSKNIGIYPADTIIAKKTMVAGQKTAKIPRYVVFVSKLDTDIPMNPLALIVYVVQHANLEKWQLAQFRFSVILEQKWWPPE